VDPRNCTDEHLALLAARGFRRISLGVQDIDSRVQEAVRRLVKAYDPLEVYLYGTYAWGNPNEDDDLNLLLIIESSEQKVYERGQHAFPG
jgi:coproporphyrinogen III oxidase-like Fe-S oxidoreductase